MKVKEKQAAQRQIDIDTDSFKLKDQEEKLQAGRYIVELVSAVLAGIVWMNSHNSLIFYLDQCQW